MIPLVVGTVALSAKDRLKTVDGYKFSIAKIESRIKLLKAQKNKAKLPIKKKALQKAIDVLQARKSKLQAFLKIKEDKKKSGQSDLLPNEDALLAELLSDNVGVVGIEQELSVPVTDAMVQQQMSGSSGFTELGLVQKGIILGVVAVSGLFLYNMIKK